MCEGCMNGWRTWLSLPHLAYMATKKIKKSCKFCEKKGVISTRKGKEGQLSPHFRPDKTQTKKKLHGTLNHWKTTGFKKFLLSYLSCGQTWLNLPMAKCQCDYITKLGKRTLMGI